MAGARRGRTFAAMTATAIPIRRSPATRAAQVLLGLLGALSLFGSVFFTVTDASGAVEWAIGAIAFAIAIGLLLAAREPAYGIPAVTAHLAFGLLKVAAYHESAAVVFMAVDAIVLALLLARRTE
jgi:hypothetical protein